MKYLTLLFGFICIVFSASAQDDGPKQVTPQLLQQIKTAVEKEVPALQKRLAKKEYNADEIAFATDTFRIERIAAKRMETDYSTMGMNTAVSDITDGYDKIMNKYYGKLISLLKPEDKKVLIATQRAWIAYRDAEFKLIGTMTDATYSGGGTIQSNIATSAYSAVVISRTKDIFNYYNNVIKDK